MAGLSTVRETLLDLKENIVEKILNELQDAVHGSDDYGRGVGAVDRDEDQSLEDGVFADDDYSSRDDSRQVCCTYRLVYSRYSHLNCLLVGLTTQGPLR